MIRIFLLVFLCASPLCAYAHPMVFSRENIAIITVREAVAPQTTNEDESTDKKEESVKEAPEKESEAATQSSEPVTTRHVFSTEIHPMSITRIGWFASREALPKDRGIMIVLENKEELSLGWSNVSTPYDVLFINHTGKIHAIVPDLVLGELTDPLEITGRIKAVLYLKAGTVKAMDIKPGDRVEHALFKPSPLILQ